MRNAAYALPFFVSKSITLDSISIVVQTLAAGNARIGIRNAPYDTNPNGGTTLIVDCGTVSVGTTGVKTITGLARTLDPGRYIINIVSDVAPSIYGTTAALAPPHMTQLIGSGGWTSYGQRYRAFTYAALPADESGQSYTLSNNVSFPAASMTVV